MSERPSTISTTVRVAALSGAAALAILGGLSLQLAAGNDPALGPKQEIAQMSAQPERRVVTMFVKRGPQPTASAPAPPVTVPAPAAAPAPAPVQTSTS